MLLILELEQLSYCSEATGKLHPCAFYLDVFCLLGKTTMSGSMSVWLLNWLWRNGWKSLNNLLLYGLIIRIWLIYRVIKDLMLDRLVGHCFIFWPGFSSQSFTTPGPGTSIINTDALSRQSSLSNELKSAENILIHLHCWSHWDMEQVTRETQINKSEPGIDLHERHFVPKAVKIQVLKWIYNSKMTCYLGKNCMSTFAHRHFLWPTLSCDIKDY